MKRLFITILAFLFLLVIAIGYYLNPYFSPAKKIEGLSVKTHSDDTIRIAYVGDSWAEGHESVECVIDSLVCSMIDKPVLVRTAGISGLTSKNIYYALFRDVSMRSVIEWGPNYCVVIAGINDSDRKMGKSYYKENMKLIIELLLENHIIPIILEIPSYDIRFSYKRRERMIKLQYLASMLMTWSKMDCIHDYRDSYIELIKEQEWNDKVITIYSDDWNPDGYLDTRGLYDGGLMHLNSKGYLVLDSCISQKIIQHIMGSKDIGDINYHFR